MEAQVHHRLSEILWERCRASAIVSVQNPLVLSEETEPYPDVTLLERRADFYSQSHPRPVDVLLVVEVADTTGDYDRRVKVPRYASAGVPDAWVVDRRVRTIDVYRNAEGDRYREQRRVGPCERLVIPGVHDEQIGVDDVLA
jgi:hypothetical protein